MWFTSIFSFYRKYRQVFLAGWQTALTYRLELCLWTLIDIIPVIPIIFIWINVYQHGHQLAQYTLNQLIFYYLFGGIINRLVVAHLEDDAIYAINNGTISKHLTKPYSLAGVLVVSEISWKVLNLFLLLIPISLVTSFFIGQIIPHVPVPNILVTGYIVICGLIIDILLSLIIVAGSFFLDQGFALSHLKWMVSGILSGGMLPLSAYPHWLERLAGYLPFQFQFALPMNTLLQLEAISFSRLLFLSMGWIILLLILAHLGLNLAFRRYTAVGG